MRTIQLFIVSLLRRLRNPEAAFGTLMFGRANRKNIFRLCLAAILILQSAQIDTLQSAFDDLGVGGRAPAMADTFVSLADDANTVLYNPAGLVQLSEGEITTQYGQLLRGLDDGSNLGTTYLGYAHPLRRGYSTFGAAYHNFKADNLFTERTIVLSYGQRLNVELFGWQGIWSGGVNLKQLYHQYEPDRFTENALNDAGVASNTADPLFQSGYGKAAYAADAGLLYQFGRKYQYSAGMAITNINRPDVSLNNAGDKVPQSMKFGLAYRPRWGSISTEVKRTKRLASASDTDISFGGERNIPLTSLGALILRGGYAEGSRGFKALTAGLGYMYSRFRLDYAFSFPISNLADTQGSHRIAFSFRLGNAPAGLDKDYSDMNLLSAFVSDSLTVHVLLTRLAVNRRISGMEKDQLLLLMMRKYTLDDPGLKDVRPELRELIRRESVTLMDWPQLKFAFTRGIPEDDKVNAVQAMELLVKGDAKSALARMALLPDNIRNNNRMAAVALIARAELSAQTYREKDIDRCLDQMRGVVEILPSDEVVMKAYRQLLLERNQASDAVNEISSETLTVPEAEVPEAPRDLVAPVSTEKPAEAPASERDVIARNFGTALGYYLSRKSEGAEPAELISLLKQMKAVFGVNGMDMSIVDRELKDLESKLSQPDKKSSDKPALEKPAPKAPAKKTMPKVAPKVKPAAETPKESTAPDKMSPELERAWNYYRQAVDRDISDYEKIEILESMLLKFGEKGAAQINKELQRIRKRLE